MGENSLGGREPKDEEGSELREGKKNQKNGGRRRKEKGKGKGRERKKRRRVFIFFMRF